MTKRIKKFCVFTGIFLALITICFVGILYYLETGYARRFILTRINNALPSKISYDSIRFSLIRGKLRLNGVLFNGPQNDKIAEVDSLVLDISLPAFRKGELKITNLKLEKPCLFLHINKDGKLNLLEALPKPKQSPKKEKKEGLPFNIVADHLEISEGCFHYTAEPSATKVFIDHIDLIGDMNLQHKKGKVDLHVRKGRIDSPKLKTGIDDFRVQAKLADSKIDPLIISLAGTPLKIDVSGNVGNIFNTPDLNIKLDLALLLPQLRENLKLKPVITGNVTGHLAVQGSIKNPEAIFSAAYSGGILADIPIDNINFECRLKDKNLSIDGLKITTGSGTTELSGIISSNSPTLGKIDLNAVTYYFKLLQNNINLSELSARIPALAKIKAGIIQSRLNIKGQGFLPDKAAADVTLELSAQNLIAGSLKAPDIRLNMEADITQGLLTLKKLEADAGNANVSADGDFSLISKEVKSNLFLDAPDLNKTLSAFGIQDIAGKLFLKAKIDGTVKQPLFDVILKAEHLGSKDINAGNVTLNAGLDRSGMFQLSELTIENQGSIIKGNSPPIPLSLENRGGEFSFSLTLDSVNIKNFYAKSPAQAIINGNLKIEGIASRPEISVNLKAAGSRYKDIHIGDISLNAALDNSGTVHLSGLEIKNQESSLHAEGWGHILDVEKFKPINNPEFQADIEAKAVSIQDFTDKVKGKISLLAHVEGSPAKPKGTIKIEGKTIDAGVQKIDAVNINADLDGEKIYIRDTQVIIGQDVIEGSGWVTLPKVGNKYEFNLKSKGLSLNRIDALSKQKIADGKIVFNISAKGTPENPELDGQITLTTLRIKDKPFNDINILLNITDYTARLSGNAGFKIDGSFHIKNKEFSAAVLFDKTDLLPYFQLAGQNALAGRLSGSIKATGNAGNINAVQADADLSDLMLLFNGEEILSSKNIRACFQNQEISAPDIVFSVLKDGQIHAKGKGKISGPLDLKIQGDVPLNNVRKLVPTVPELSGNIGISANIAGAASKPEIQAELVLKDISMVIDKLNQKINNLNGKIKLTPQQLILSDIAGSLDTGGFDLSGNVALKNFQPENIDVKLNANALPVNVPGMIDMLLNAGLKISGTPEKSLIDGEIVILEGKYYKDVNLSLILTAGKHRRKESAPPKEITNPFLKNMSLDISVRRREPFRIENNLVMLSLEPDLHIGGHLNNPSITGRADVSSGTITYQKKVFEIKKGVIDFLNPYRIEPSLDMESYVPIRDWTIFLNLSGTPDNLNFKLRSEPQLEDADILSLLAIGKTAQELIANEGGSSQSPERMAAEIIAKTLGENIKEAAGIDILEVEFNEQGQGATDDVKVTIGKELSRRMSVKYAVESKKGEFVRRAIAEYRFLENLLMTGFQDSKGTFGAELNFMLEFR